MRMALLIAILLTPPACGRVDARPDVSFRIGGAIQHPRTWTAAELAKAFPDRVQTVRFSMQGKEHAARCVPLWALVETAGLQLDPARKMHHVAFVVLVRARDGYTVCFSEGELDPNLGNRPVWLAFEVDGQPLPEKEGPARLLVPGEGKGHMPRWVYGISSITVLDGAALTEPPSGAARAVTGAAR
jgi:DMSO/TMAO reductase YedYZ molybdopterin-dependent catalytic subunit